MQEKLVIISHMHHVIDFVREKELNESYQKLLEKLSNCQKTLSNAHEVMILFIEMDDCLSMLSEFEVCFTDLFSQYIYFYSS